MNRRLALLLLLALDACRPSAPETPDAGPVPDAPTAVTAVLENGSIVVRWTLADGTPTNATVLIARASVPNADSRPAATELQVIAGFGADAPSLIDADVEVGHFYVYAVAIRSAGGRSTFTLQTNSVTLGVPSDPCTGPATASDSDGDGLTDAVETTGWQVVVDEDGVGTLSTRTVKSSPFIADTDGDGVCDDEESTLKLDPRLSDTDGDGLTDFDELNRWGSNPTDVDSDDDAKGNPIFYDGAELATFHTSPTLADTDGDGRDDFQELNQDSTNALVAEIPQPALAVVGKMDLGLDVRLESGAMQSNAVTQGLEQGTSTALSNSSSTANQHSVEEGFSVSAEASAGYPSGASVEVTGTASAKETYVKETTASVSRSSTQDSQSTYESAISGSITNNSTITGGHLGLDFEVRNEGTRTFQLSSVVVTALRRSPSDPTTFTSVATLQFPSQADNLVLSEGQSIGPIRASADLSAGVALDLLSNPGTLFFQTANYSLTDKTGEAFSFSIGEETASRTALLTLDFGGVRPLERYRVATNVERNASGKAAGVKLGDVLRDVLGLAAGTGFETAVRAGGTHTVLTKLRDVEALPGTDGGVERLWVLFAPTNPDAQLTPVSQRLTTKDLDFEDLVLLPRDAVTLAYVGDVDHDGLFDREELMYGTSDQNVDTDGDGLTDFEEVRTGWPVMVDNAFYQANPRVFANPLEADADRDSLSDTVEKMKGTDPNRRDTDNDGLADDVDPFPVQGPKGSWVKLVGTSLNDSVLQVLPAGDAVYVLGTSAGDIDGDGTPNGPFVMALDANTGAQRWVKQNEGATKFMRKLVVTNGKVRWLTEVGANFVTGQGAAFCLVSFDLTTGATTARDLTNEGSNGAYALNKVGSGTMEPRSGGGSIAFFAPFTQFNGKAAYLQMQFDGDGVPGATTFFSEQGTNDVYAQLASSSSARGTASLISFRTASCTSLGHAISISGGSSLSSCGQTPIRSIALDARGGILLALNDTASDRVELRPVVTNSPAAWTKTFAADFPQNVRITSVEADEVNQYYVGAQAAAGALPSRVFILAPSGAVLDSFPVGNTTTKVNSTRRDAAGNLFLGASSTGGFPAASGSPQGGDDLVIVRNPQLIF